MWYIRKEKSTLKNENGKNFDTTVEGYNDSYYGMG